MVTELIVWAILGLHPEWRPDACDRVFATDYNKAYCERARDDGRAWAEQLAPIIEAESTRQDVPWPWVVAVIEIESGFSMTDPCPFRLAVSRITSREVIDADEGKERVCWTYRAGGTDLTNCQPVIVVSEDEEQLVIDRCAAGEAGPMQLVYSDARPGQVVPATGEELPRSSSARHERIMDPQVNISLGVLALATARDACCCQTDDLDEPVCDEACEGDYTEWVGHYNTGHCESEKGDRYEEKVSRRLAAAFDYACQQVPDAEPYCSSPPTP